MTRGQYTVNDIRTQPSLRKVTASPRLKPGDFLAQTAPSPHSKARGSNVLHPQHQQGTAQPCPYGKTSSCTSGVYCLVLASFRRTIQV